MARRSLRQFSESLKGQQDRKAVKAALDAWYREVHRADWSNPADVKRDFGTASIVGNNRVVFNIKGNDYRLITAINYRRRVVFIKWIGAHRDYDKIDVRTVKYGD
ncbi:MAG TPA: type II toxin-antitoxin system HigB family toxin [Candidatus Acidoferrum sp.]|nr:type II toxin-antitoxin system HigB family toxin [Candidatus Acidoferrum sp.]